MELFTFLGMPISGIEATLDLGILTAIFAGGYVVYKERIRHFDENRKNDLQSVFEDAKRLSLLVEELYKLLGTDWSKYDQQQKYLTFKKQHEGIWQFLNELKFNAAARCSTELYKNIALSIDRYKHSVETKGDFYRGIYCIAILLGYILHSVRDDKEVVDDYLKARFGLELAELEREIEKN